MEEKRLAEIIEWCKDYVEHYEYLLKYTNHSVKRKKVLAELTWWKQELNKETAKTIKD